MHKYRIITKTASIYRSVRKRDCVYISIEYIYIYIPCRSERTLQYCRSASSCNPYCVKCLASMHTRGNYIKQ